MSVLPWSTPPVFSTGVPLSWADVMVLFDNAITLDSLSLKGRRAWTDQVDDFDDANLDPSPLSRAGLWFRTGLTTLTLVTKTANGSGHTLRVFFDGAGSPAATFTLSNTTQTHTITLTGRGWGDRTMHEVVIDVDRSSGNAGDYKLLDAYVSPVSAIVSGSWPGLPTFGAISAANLAQLASAQQWLFDRINAVSMPVPQGILYRTRHAWVSTKQLWRGGVARSNGANYFTAVVGYQSFNTPAQRLRLLINGSEVATTPSIVAGAGGTHQFLYDLSGYTDQALLEVALEQVVTSGWPGGEGSIPTRWNLRWVEVTQNTRTYTIPVAYSVARESLTYSQLQSRLNSIVSACTAVYNRVTGAADMWDRARLYRQMPVIDDYAREYFARSLVARSRRYTDGLWLRGKGVTIHYGALGATPGKGEDPFYDWETTFKQDLITGEEVADKYVGFDSLPGLVEGEMYYLTGDVRAAFEVYQ